MTIHDRIALELGRALMRAHAAEGQLADANAKSADLTKKLAEAEKRKPAARTAK